jgi:hypothetical protein
VIKFGNAAYLVKYIGLPIRAENETNPEEEYEESGEIANWLGDD